MRYHQITPQVVDEVAMNPGEFGKAISAGGEAGVLVGFEFEVIMPEETTLLDIGDGPTKKEDEKIDHEWIGDLFFREDFFGNRDVNDISPSQFDGLFKFKQSANPQVATMTEAAELVLRKHIEHAKEKFYELTPQQRRYYTKIAKSKLEKDPWAETRVTDNEELQDEYDFARTFFKCLTNSNDRETSWSAQRVYNDIFINYDDLFQAVFRSDTSDIDQSVNDYLEYDPKKVFIELEIDEYYSDRDYDDDDDSDEDYQRGTSVLKPIIGHTFGTDVQVFNRYHESTKNMTSWYIEPDGSIEAEDNDVGMEVVTPPLPAGDAIEAITKFYGVARRYGLYTNHSTGLHINVSIPQTVDVLKLALFLGDQHVLATFNREDNGYARSIIKQLTGEIESSGTGIVQPSGTKARGQRLPSTANYINYDALKSLASRLSQRHTTSINGENHKYISFRHAGDDYLKQVDDVKNVVGRFIRAMIIASDPESHKQEYLKKLYQLTDQAGRYEPAWDGKQVALRTVQDIRQNGVPILVAYFMCPTGRFHAEKLGTKIAYDLGGRDDMWETTKSSVAREHLLRAVKFEQRRKAIESAPDENFFRVVVYPKMNAQQMFAGHQDAGLDIARVTGMDDWGAYTVAKARVPMTSNRWTKSLVSQLINRYKTGR